MKDVEIKGFGSKMMVASKSVNKIPNEFLRLALNTRIYDAGIGARRGKRLICESMDGTFNKGGFLLKNKLYQITNSRIYEVKENGERIEKGNLGYDVFCDILVYDKNFAIIVAKGQKLKVFDGNSISEPQTVPSGETGNILEYTRGYTFYGIGNILYISRPILPTNPERAYDFVGAGSQNITYDSEITGLKGTMNGLYVFTKDKVEFIGSENLTNVNGVAAFSSSPLGNGGEPINNQSIVASGDKIFFITKNLQLKTINYVAGTENTTIGNLNNNSIVSIKEFLNTLDENQEIGFAFYNQNDETIQFHLKTKNFKYNNITIIYDLLNKTFSIDIGKNYCYVVKKENKYFGFSSVNSSVYEDDIGNTDAGIPIGFKIVTQDMNAGTIMQKRFGGIFTAGAISSFSDLNYVVRIDGDIVFQDVIRGGDFKISGIGEIGGDVVGKQALGGDLGFKKKIFPFEKVADEGRIYKDGTRIQIEINSSSLFQDFIIDYLGFRCALANNIDIRQKW